MTAYNDVRCESVLNEYLPIYRALEESLAKRLFASRGISDDVIAATMHEFLKKDDDHEVRSLDLEWCFCNSSSRRTSPDWRTVPHGSLDAA
jgi:hypothetical protein